MKSIYIQLKSGWSINVFGEAKIDPIENSVVVDCESGAVSKFYWPNVDVLIESEFDPEADNSE